MLDDFGPASEPHRGTRDRLPGFTCRVGGAFARCLHFALQSPSERAGQAPGALTLPALRADVEPMPRALQNSEPVADGDTDEALITGAAGGDADALAQLYDRYASALLAAGERMLGSRRDAEDLLHDVFVEVWQQAGDYDSLRGSVKSWLFLRMRSRAIDRLRLASKKNVELGDQVLATATRELAEDPALSPDRAQVRSTLEVLPPDQRVAIELAYFGGLSGAQIAAQLGVPLGTVKTRLALGMSKLRAVFGEDREVGE
jgi:RNA polymerase sigma-70 factor (ECF subfamily)